ncbi:DUF4399 domain-containing protein [Litoreibacter arenae]|uniref:ATPase of the AAA+ class n=1 Tax=Litoreibacter arenae DSM 19593 TaxID=1123360 RepID=S9QCB7_9RHOB|nr:DUF4399 domain-containing protein [Litoreibacter arenae]EPX79056.1 ATPase of the AAA+ class [Litoreibacter arenae DSM 19593]
MKHIMFAAALGCAQIAGLAAFAGDRPSVPGTETYIVNLKDGDVVSSPVTILFGVKGMGVAPAGIEKDGTGHHHLLINRPPMGQGEDGAEEYDYGMVGSDNLIHYGGGQTETVLDLPPGDHTLQLVFADLNHVPFEPSVESEQITITVSE